MWHYDSIKHYNKNIEDFINVNGGVFFEIY